MFSKLRSRYGVAGPLAVVALVAIAIAGVPAIAQPVANTSANIFKLVKRNSKVGQIANKRSVAANKRSVNAIKLARGADGKTGPKGEKGDKGDRGPRGEKGDRGAQGEKGEKGDQGPSGQSTGPAGGSLEGTYPNPTIADDVIGSDEVQDNSLTGDDIDEATVNADRVDNHDLVTLDWTANTGDGPDLVFDHAGLQISAECQDDLSPLPVLTAATDTPGASISVAGVAATRSADDGDPDGFVLNDSNRSLAEFDGEFEPGDVFPLNPPSPAGVNTYRFQGTISYRNVFGGVATGTFTVHFCTAFGTVMTP